MQAELVDAQEMHKKNPDTFEVPSYVTIARISPGSLVQIASYGERFWVEVTRVNQPSYRGRVDNDLLKTDEHGFDFNDSVNFEARHIHKVYHG